MILQTRNINGKISKNTQGIREGKENKSFTTINVKRIKKLQKMNYE